MSEAIDRMLAGARARALAPSTRPSHDADEAQARYYAEVHLEWKGALDAVCRRHRVSRKRREVIDQKARADAVRHLEAGGRVIADFEPFMEAHV